MKRRHFLLTASTLAATAVAGTACTTRNSESGSGGEDYPTKDITLIVQAKAGGGSDLASRALATAMEPIIGRSIIVENRPGASGSTAMLHVKSQPADGYVIGFGPVEIAMLGSMNYDIKPADYDLLGQIMLGPGVLSVPADSPYNTLPEFVAGAKEKEVTVANSGAGSIWELTGSSLAQMTGAQIKPVPFDGGAPAVAAVLGNQVDAAASGVNEVKQNLADGKLKVLAIFHAERHPELKDVPTAKEQGVDLEIGGWGGIYAPKGLPEAVRKKLEDAIKKAVESESYQKTITASGNLVVYKDAAAFTEFASAEAERFAKLIGS
ncbi:tripartite tricarboxylate transporter substrate binding protein [Arachnia propionica]|uniref:Tripartite tricarboxylate transporter substrate binding protein n=1 Tax=Arachnia propionica TaxID=1750 RepID=A0A3P1WWR2_9ACTN|nr:tripartite tricarboxylate transporter substrate binding protein [Arachnia propionica]RRD50999.1 tripartite tricarboxylate transporter substrate binding protein [Arachnia propionica]